MTALPRVGDYAGVMLDALQAQLGQSVDRSPLSKWDAIAGMMSAGNVRATQIVAAKFDAGTLDRSIGTDVDAYCAGRGPVRRFAAVSANGTVSFLRPGTGASGIIPSGTQFTVPYNGNTIAYATTQDVTYFDSTPSAPVVVNCAAVTPGAAGNLGSLIGSTGTVSSGLLLTGQPAALYDTTIVPISVTVAGGADAESDDDLKVRQRLWEQSRQRGTDVAIAFAALQTPGVKHAVVAVREDIRYGSQAVVYVGDINYNTSATLLSAVATSIEAWRSFGPSAPVRSIVSTTVPVTIAATLAQPLVRYNTTALQLAMVQRVVDYFTSRVDPYAYDINMLRGRIARANDDINSVTLVTPTTSVVSPLSPSAVNAAGGFPASLVRYISDPSVILVSSLTGPT